MILIYKLNCHDVLSYEMYVVIVKWLLSYRLKLIKKNIKYRRHGKRYKSKTHLKF